jgi:anaerobic dimethyl sulfoxide reductase subunit A
LKVTERIMEGVVAMPQGAWYRPDNKGVDRGGCINTLTKYHPTPLAKGNPQHTNLVQVERYEEEAGEANE